MFVAAAGLKPSAGGKRIVCDGEERTVVDGPFPAAQELIAGFSIWEVADMDEAVAWARHCPNVMPGRSELEIRPFFEVVHLGGFVTPDEAAALRAVIAGRSASPDLARRGAFPLRSMCRHVHLYASRADRPSAGHEQPCPSRPNSCVRSR